MPDPIGVLIRTIAASADTFGREGVEHAGPAAAQFLAAKLGAHRGGVVSLDEFVDRLASTWSRNGQPYEVRRRDGTTVTMQQWLRDALRAHDAAAARARK